MNWDKIARFAFPFLLGFCFMSVFWSFAKSQEDYGDGNYFPPISAYGNPPEISSWYARLRQPDNPYMSCCGEADAYWADSFEMNGRGEYVAIITDERDMSHVGRPPRQIGEKWNVPNNKIKWDQGNPTGHGVIFINGQGQILCYVPPGGV